MVEGSATNLIGFSYNLNMLFPSLKL